MLEVRNLSVSFPGKSGRITVVDDVSYGSARARCWGSSASSGSGKSVTALSILRLIQSPGAIDNGQVLFEAATSWPSRSPPCGASAARRSR